MLFLNMITFSVRILKFERQGEKTGWSYIEISRKQAEQLNPGCRTSFRVKGQLDDHTIEKVAVIPVGEGNFILPFNATLRKATGKKAGDKIRVRLERDVRQLRLSSDFMSCLRDDPRAYAYFQTLPKSHQRYFSKWIEDAKTLATKTKRITMAVIALGAHQGYGEMIRSNKGMR
jgi:hypothetical protein